MKSSKSVRKRTIKLLQSDKKNLNCSQENLNPSQNKEKKIVLGSKTITDSLKSKSGEENVSKESFNSIDDKTNVTMIFSLDEFIQFVNLLEYLEIHFDRIKELEAKFKSQK